MNCEKCNSEKFIEGTLEGVSFVPCSEERKKFKNGVYGLNVLVCRDCGNVASMGIDAKTLCEILKK